SQVVHAIPKSRAIRIVLNVPAPSNVAGAHGGPECAAHTGLLGALLCPDMIKSGNLLLVWSWDAPGYTIDGFHVYRVDGATRRLVDTVRTKGDLTLSDVPKPAGGFGRACYAVGAFSGAGESALGAPYCADGRSAAVTTRLWATEVREADKASAGGSMVAGTGQPKRPDRTAMVGFSYYEQQNLILRDDFANTIARMGVAFDVSGLRGRTLVSAILHLPVESSTGQGNNHSCATDVGTGSEFWWNETGWIDGAFGNHIVPTDTGPVASADVTAIVAPWLRGEPNYGFVVKNDDENTGAFTNETCQTIYSNPTLDVTYY
ncbi:MAG: DNRLRE domain-containing protein, partial [Candidatus Eremiobacteraeota bacterium]|nr:DNRLRE domain-containing protein [Candidatus Eremiobacteraeota bacterium]